LVLAAAAAADQAPDRTNAERYVREQRSTATLLGAEPDDLPVSLAEVSADLERVHDDVQRSPSDRFPTVSLCADGDLREPGWAAVSRLAPSLVPSWAAHPREPRLHCADLRVGLRRLMLRYPGGVLSSPRRRTP
ncbi:MAG: oxygenase MpaB family protein, partial [Janthinobacterium lividum]